MRLTPASVLEVALEAAVLTEDEKQALRENLAASLVLMHMDWIGGTDAEDDCPREPGSKAGSRMRPNGEGLTAGAAWLQDWRLP